LADETLPLPPRELTPLERAQDLMYRAFDSTGEKRVTLARKALAISEDCADAYVLLAEETADWQYNRALAEFKSRGATARADKLLNSAFKTNRFVPAYLLGIKKFPRTPARPYRLWRRA